ncbi:MAG TPA: flagellar basal body P-ring formation chaperone FlgA [Candidatus Hydrogenedentes bacterium]|jgi:flagella basal body P-ring formation protein FlgA|nr:flagellar basal body P-ring formation chaperone FlgA [Candidatus Hydrogenedentota bacterium]HPJ99415.1 flagellar basal body P-ring formation chaperone FlgA [Candidatus Hydrogenedentota bacterium]
MNREQTPHRLLFAWAAAAVLFLAAVRADALNVVLLRDEAFVKGPQVALGDVADIEGAEAEALAGLEILPAAAPGCVKRIHASMLRSRIMTAGYRPEDFEITGAESVNATTLCVELTREMLVDDLRRFIELEMPWDPANATVDIDPPTSKLVLPEGDIVLEWRPAALFQYLGKGTMRGEALVDGQVRDVIYCQVNVQAYGDVVVASSDIPRGAIISRGDLSVAKRALSAMRNGYYSDPEELAGMVARSTIFPDTVLTSRHVMPRRIIKRNQVVTVEVRAGTLMVRDRAQAMSNAAAGDIIICQRMNSKEEFQGIVREDGIVEVY